MGFSRRAFLASASAVALGQTAGSRALRDRLTGEFDKLLLFDTHEHLWDEKDRVSGPIDFYSLVGDYVMSDLVSAGLGPEDGKLLRDPQAPAAARWKAFEPYWKRMRLTGYARALRLAVRDLYGVEEITAAGIAKIDDGLRTSNRPGIYRRMMRDRARIRVCVQDDYWHAAPVRAESDLMVLARRFDRFIVAASRALVGDLEKLTDTSIATLSDLTRALERNFEANLEAGMVTVKIGLAYMRELRFENVPQAEAAREFEGVMKDARPLPEGFPRSIYRPYRKLEDYMFHQVVRLADAHGVPMQIHTGILAGNRAMITNTKAAHLLDVFLRYPRVRFDLFHISYPYQGELAAIVKSFPNVFADFCWAHVISPEAAVATLAEMLDSAPASKILAFGGDYHYPELSYAHARMARSNVAHVLATKIEQGACGEDEALGTGIMLLHDNGAEFFLSGRSKAAAVDNCRTNPAQTA